MGSKLKKIRSLNLKTKFLFAGTILSLGLIGTFLLNNFLRNNYNSRKSELEDRIENFINKKVSLGDYSGIRFLGFSLGYSKIVDKKNIDSGIQTKNVYVGIMPLRSFLKQKWIVKISPKEAAINIDRNFFNRMNHIKMLEVQKNLYQSMN